MAVTFVLSHARHAPTTAAHHRKQMYRGPEERSSLFTHFHHAAGEPPQRSRCSSWQLTSPKQAGQGGLAEAVLDRDRGAAPAHHETTAFRHHSQVRRESVPTLSAASGVLANRTRLETAISSSVLSYSFFLAQTASRVQLRSLNGGEETAEQAPTHTCALPCYPAILAYSHASFSVCRGYAHKPPHTHTRAPW